MKHAPTRLAFAAALASAAAPAAAQTVQLLANHTHLTSTNPNGASAQVQVTVGPYRTDALVLVSAQGRSRYDGGGGVSTGIRVGIVESNILVEDDSSEAKSSKISFWAAVSHSFVLKAGTSRLVTARTLPYGSGSANNKPTSISMDLHAIAVQ